MRQLNRLLLALAILLVAAVVPGAASAVDPDQRGGRPTLRGIPGEIDVSADKELAAWQRLQFGMFIHWGLYSELGGVWNGKPVERGYSEQIQMWANIAEQDYLEVAARFRPERFDPAAICSLAKDAGMRYVVITSKHHDGFSMFDTATTDYDVVDATPYGKDPLKRLADECRRQGLGFGVYFSLVDWHQGHEFDGNNNNPIPASMEPVIEAQLRELMTGYGEIAEVWFDMSSPTAQQSARFAGIVRELQPRAAINSRVWNNAGDFRTLGDNETPDVALDGAWQTPASIYHATWGYRSWQVRDDLAGKVRDLVRGLASVRARGGNYLLNIGPRGDGSVVEFEADVLRGIGDWIRRHPGAVIGASATRFGGQPWGEVTVNGRNLFLHVLDRPADGQLRLPGLATGIHRVAEDGGDALAWRQDGNDLVVTLPEVPLDDVLPVVEVELAGDLRVIPPGTVAADDQGAWVLGPDDWDTGYSYADDGSYYSTHRTTVRQTAYLSSPRPGPVSVKVVGDADPAGRYRVQLGERSTVVTGAELTGSVIGSFTVAPGQVTALTITRAGPARTGKDLGLRLASVVVAPAGAVVAWPQVPDELEAGTSTFVPLHLTNFGRTPVDGEVGLEAPDGWTVGAATAFAGLRPGETRSAPTAVGIPADASPGSYSLTAWVRTAAAALGLAASVDVVLPNVAVGRPAAQSSTAWGGLPGRAVDGNTAGDYLRDGSASHTAEPSHQAWWQVDLERSVSIDEIEIWNRTDCCTNRLADYWVIVSDAPISGDSLADARTAPGVTAVHRPEAAGRPTTIDLDGVRGRYVRIQLESATNPLSLTEVKVRATG